MDRRVPKYEYRKLAAKLGELDVFITALRYLTFDAPFTTELERLEAIKGMYLGTIKARVVPGPAGQVKLEFYKLGERKPCPSCGEFERCLVVCPLQSRGPSAPAAAEPELAGGEAS